MWGKRLKTRPVDEKRQELIAAVFRQRADVYQLPDYEISESLNDSARLKAEHMAENKYFAHEWHGVGPGDFITGAGYEPDGLGENIAEDVSGAGVVDMWHSSEGHRWLLEQPFEHAGFGVARYRKGWLWVLHVASPKH